MTNIREDENVRRVIYLENTKGTHNKFYRIKLFHNNNSTFTAEWGPLSGKWEKDMEYPMHKLHKILSQKTSYQKGYVEIFDETFDRNYGVKTIDPMKKESIVHRLDTVIQAVVGSVAFTQDRIDKLNRIRTAVINDNVFSEESAKYANTLWKLARGG